ncbi:hypothetical protein EWW49_34325, partial [Pseudomonas syringae]
GPGRPGGSPRPVPDAHAAVRAWLRKCRRGTGSAIGAAGDTPQLGASKALIGAGRTEIKTYGVDGTPEVRELMRRDDSPLGAVVAQQPALIGTTAVQNVARYLAGQHDLPKEAQVPTLRTPAANLPDGPKLRGGDRGRGSIMGCAAGGV